MTEPDPDAADADVLGVVRRVARAAHDVDGRDPLDEATHRRLDHHGLADTEAWTHGGDGFALRHGETLDLVVAPDARGRGVGGRLAADAVVAPGPLLAWSHGDHPAAAALARRHGFARARELWVMRRPASEPLPDLVVPDGVEIRGYRDADRAEVLRVNAAAFADHPEQGGMDEADLTERMAQDWFDPAGLLVADTGETPTRLSGFHWTKQHDDALGEVYVVGIDPSAQGAGLGRALTLAGLRHLERRGVGEVLLYVEADNAPARAVYTRLGFTHAAPDTHVQYRRG